MAADSLELQSIHGRGRAEVLRLMLAFAGKAFKDSRMSLQQWRQLRIREGLGDKKLPLLRVNGTQEIVGAVGIGRYLAVSLGLYGMSSSEQSEIDALVAEVEALNERLGPVLRATLSRHLDERKELWVEFREEVLHATLERWSTILSTRLFLVGSKISWADITICELLTRFSACFDSFFLAGYPVLREFVERFEKLPNVHNYISERPSSNF